MRFERDSFDADANDPYYLQYRQLTALALQASRDGKWFTRYKGLRKLLA